MSEKNIKAKSAVKNATAKSTAVKSSAAKNSNKGYEFYNCDEAKSHESMNPEYNRELYKDTKIGRNALLAKIDAEREAGTIQISDYEAAKAAIIDGTPTDANAHITYGCIVEKVLV